jgi:uncharacterized protein (DUF58 family)
MTIDPGFLDELDRFQAALDRGSNALRQGDQESPAVGEGLTFSDYRRYAPGDDTRLIDWKLYARTDEYYIKQFEEERELVVHVLIDASGSMDFGEGEAYKFDYAAKVGLGIAYLTAEANNEFRVSLLREDFDRIDRDRSSRGEVLALIDRCNEATVAGESDLEAALSGYEATIGSRSLVVVVSDFLNPPDAIETGIAALADNDLLLAHVVAPGERDLSGRGDAVVSDPETGAETRTYLGGQRRETYRDRFDAHVDEIAARAETVGAPHSVVDTGTPFFDAFAELWLGLE